jgi:hypothetical protein
LQRVSGEILKPRQEHLVLVVDGLDEIEWKSDGSNPLQNALPHALPPWVKVLCASRSTYPYLNWLEAREGVYTLDLDGERWAASNEEAVRQYWQYVAPRFVPPLAPSFVGEIVQRAGGNVLYAVKLAEWLHPQPPEKRRVELLPRGLEALLDESWDQIQRLPSELRRIAVEGLGVVAVAREALPLSILAAVAGWKEPEHGEVFLRVTHSFLFEEPGHETKDKAWRPFHESFRSFILAKLGRDRTHGEHERLAERLCRWSADANHQGFRRSYAVRHGVSHWLKAGQWEQAYRLCTDMRYLMEKCSLTGVLSVEDDLKAAMQESPQYEREVLRDLHRAIQAESHHLRKDPGALSLLVYNWLRSSGWAGSRIEQTMFFSEGLPPLRLRHPIKVGRNERTLAGHVASVPACAVTSDGRRVVSASDDGTLKVWELETGREISSLEIGGFEEVTDCAVTPDGRHAVVASNMGTLTVWELETGREVAVLKGHKEPVTGCVVTLDGRHVVSTSEDDTLRIWELETGREVARLKGHTSKVTACVVTPDGQRVVSASMDETLKVWELATGQEVATLRGHRRTVTSCAVTPDGQHVVSASWDSTLRVWNLDSGQEVDRLEGPGF